MHNQYPDSRRMVIASVVQYLALIVSVLIMFRDPRSFPFIFPYIACSTILAIETTVFIFRPNKARKIVMALTYAATFLSIAYGFMFWPLKGPGGVPKGHIDWFVVSFAAYLVCFTLAQTNVWSNASSNNPAA